MTSEYDEYINAMASNAVEMIATIDAMKERLTESLGAEHHATINQFAKAAQDELIGESFRASLAPFVQEPEGEEETGMRAAR